jgi:hypothetical protein
MPKPQTKTPQPSSVAWNSPLLNPRALLGTVLERPHDLQGNLPFLIKNLKPPPTPIPENEKKGIFVGKAVRRAHLQAERRRIAVVSHGIRDLEDVDT